MEFPITELLSPEESEQWILKHFHPQGLKCPWCQAPVERANLFRVTRKSQLKVYRCRECKHIYNLYTNTVLQQHHLTPQQVVLLLRGILKGETTNELAIFYAFAKSILTGISSQVRPSSILPALFFCTPPHCLKKTAPWPSGTDPNINPGFIALCGLHNMRTV